MTTLIVNLTLALLLLLSVISWSIAGMKFFSMRKQARLAQHFEFTKWGKLDWDHFTRHAEAGEGDLALLAVAAVQSCAELGADSGLDGNTRQELLARQLGREREAITRARERGLAELATIGSSAPFVGLFGTVWGIMNALKSISASGQASIDVVAGPIGEALIATAIGIATAIPAVLFYNYFLRQLKLHVGRMQGFSEDVERVALKNRADWS